MGDLSACGRSDVGMTADSLPVRSLARRMVAISLVFMELLPTFTKTARDTVGCYWQ